MILFWTSARADTVRRTIGVSLKAMRPAIPEHHFVDVDAELLEPAPGQIVMCCGNQALDILKAAKLVPRNQTLNSMREKVFKPKAAGGVYIMTFDPTIVANEPEKQAIIDWDIRLAVRFMQTGTLQPKLGDYRWVPSFAAMIERIKQRYAKTGEPVDVSCDTETMGLHSWYPDRHIITIGFADRPGHGEMLYTGSRPDPVPVNPDEDIHAQIEWLLTSPMVKLRMANGKYDLVWIAEKWGIECTNFKLDTCLVGSLLDENRINSLNLQAKLFSDIGGYDTDFNDTYDKNKMDEVPFPDLLTYGAGDLDATYQAADVLREQLIEDGQLARFYVKIMHPAARAFERIERRGVLVDQNAMHQLADDLTAEIEQSRKTALQLLPARLRVQHHEKIADQLAEGKNPLTPAILKDFFFGAKGLNLEPTMVTKKTGEPSTARAHLRQFVHVPEAAAMCQVLEGLGSAEKTLSTFVLGFLKHLRPDGMFHSSYILHHGDFNDDEDEESGTVSGRLAAKEPPIQVLPKKTKWAKRLRACYPAPPGKVVVVIDYEQGELKIVACLAPEPTMIASYKNGLDLHAVTGAKLGGYDFEDFLALKESDRDTYDLIRDRAKPANFGLLYDMSPEGFRAYCWAQYGLLLSLEEATTMHAAFFELYPGLHVYHDNMRSFVHSYRYVRSPLGRVRHLETIKSWDRSIRNRSERQAINSPVQSTLTDMMCWAISEIDRQLPEDKFAIVGMIHDNLIAYADIDQAEHYARQAAAIMRDLPKHEFDWTPQLQFTAGIEIGPTLAQLSKLKLAA